MSMFFRSRSLLFRLFFLADNSALRSLLDALILKVYESISKKFTVTVSIRNCLINFDFDWKPSMTKLTWSNNPWIILKCIKRDLSRSLWSGFVCGWSTIFTVFCKRIQQMLLNFRLTICLWDKRIYIFVVWSENGHHTRYGNFFKPYDGIGV